MINNYNRNFFKTIDTELKAYILGYIVADGCITIERSRLRNNSVIKRVQFQPSIDDLQVITLIRDSIAPTNKLTFVKSKRPNRKDSVKLRIANKDIVNDLIALYDIIPRKTYHSEFKFPKMDGVYKKHFIRGYFDGDGSVGEKHFSMVFNSETFAKEVLKEFIDVIPDLKHYLYTENRHTTTYYSLHFSVNKKSRVDLFNFLYKDCNFKLDRKYNKALNTVLNKEINSSLSV